MGIFTHSLGLIRKHRRAYWILNAIYYGLIAVAMMVVSLHPNLQQALGIGVQKDFQKSLPGLVSAYQTGNILKASLWTFMVNSTGGSFASVTLPSLIVPFSGMLLMTARMILWGLMFSPTTHMLRVVMAMHWLTIVLEGQAYILTAFGSYLLGKWWLFPKSGGMQTHLEGYVAGLKANFALYSLILPVLAISAVYEASEMPVIRHFLGR
jgi:hypothetical protein